MAPFRRHTEIVRAVAGMAAVVVDTVVEGTAHSAVGMVIAAAGRIPAHSRHFSGEDIAAALSRLLLDVCRDIKYAKSGISRHQMTRLARGGVGELTD